MDTAKKFQICLPDPRRAKGLHAGGCPHPQWCAEKGECYYGKVEPLNDHQRSASAGPERDGGGTRDTPSPHAPLMNKHEGSQP